jgi:hypothetical protein
MHSADSFQKPLLSRTFLLLATLAAGPGCYRYAPVELPSLEPDAEVRLTLNDDGSHSVLPGAYATGRRTVEGRFTSSSQDSVVINVWIGEAYRGTPFEPTYQRVAISRHNVVAVEDRQLSKARTALVAAGVVAVIVTLIDRLGVLPIFGDDGDPGPIPPPGSEGLIHRR